MVDPVLLDECSTIGLAVLAHVAQSSGSDEDQEAVTEEVGRRSIDEQRNFSRHYRSMVPLFTGRRRIC